MNGPNLNRLGKRDPKIYGNLTSEQILVDLQTKHTDIHFCYYQSNYEGYLIDKLQWAMEENESICSGDNDGEPISGVIMNPGGLCHTSVSLRDAVEETVGSGIKVIEVHISDITKREPFRQKSLVSEVSTYSIIGKGTDGYRLAVEYLLQNE